MNGKSVIINFIWKLMEKVGSQIITLIISLILARLLDPATYGVVALVTVITSLLQVFVDSGFGNALIQKKDADNKDFSTVFFFNVIMCLSLYIIIYALAPWVAVFFEKSELTLIIRVLSLTIVFSGVKNVQEAYVSKNMIFKKFFFATLSGSLGAAVLGIVMAYKGFGVWALVVQSVVDMAVSTIILWITVPWRPNLYFSMERLKNLFSFGSKLLVARVIASLYTNARQLLIGKLYDAEALAFYNKGHEIPGKIVPSVVTSINSIMLPTLSREQESKEKVLNMVRIASRLSSYVIWPAMIGLAVCGELLIDLLLTEKWLACVPYLCIFCIDYAFWPVIYVYNNALNAMGRSDIYLKIQIIQKILGVIALVLSLRKGVIAVAICVPLISFLELIFDVYYLNKLLSYKIKQQIKDIIQPILLAIFMGVIVFHINIPNINKVLLLIIKVVIGVMVYIPSLFITKVDIVYYIVDLVKRHNKNSRSSK